MHYLKNAKLILYVSMLFFMTGCASTAPDYDDSLSEDEAPASVTFNQMFFEKLDYGEERREFFTLNLLHEFEEGKSVYRAFELPEYIKPYHVTIRSRMYKDNGEHQLFLPLVDKLAADFSVNEKYEASKKEARLAVARSKPLEFQLVIGETDRFLVIHSRAEVFSKAVDENKSDSATFARAGNLDIVLPLRGE